MRRSRTLAALVAAVALTVVVAACEPVTPTTPRTEYRFEGYRVIQAVPADPVGIVYLFHGSYGSAAFANKLEVTDLLNTLTARGYGFVATESTQRTDPKRWDTRTVSITANPDLARLARLHAHLVATTGVDADTPIHGVGMSNGAGFVTVFAQVFADAGYPVAAIAPVMGGASGLVRVELDVPSFFVIAEHDTVVDNGDIVAAADAMRARGVPVDLRTHRESDLTAARFLRVPGVDPQEAQAVFDAYVATGAWDPTGSRAVPVDEAVTRGSQAVLPASLTAAQRIGVRDQAQVVLALHEFTAQHAIPIANFFDRHR